MMTEYESIQELPREKLLELCEMFSKNWLALDGLWFQSIEHKRGMDEAVEHDVNAWARFTETEARRIKEFLGRPSWRGSRACGARWPSGSTRRSTATRRCSRATPSPSMCGPAACRTRAPARGCPTTPASRWGYPDMTDESSRCVWRFTLDPQNA